MTTAQQEKINGLDVAALRQTIAEIEKDARKAKVKFGVTTRWSGGTRSDTAVEGYEIGGQWVDRRFNISIDEPHELLGANSCPNPQEYLMAAFNACMLVGYVAGASVHGIELEKLEIETEGELDLRGFLGLDSSVKPGYDEIHYTVRIAGKGTQEQFQDIHRTVMATSPNRWNIANPIRLTSELVVE